MRKISYISLLIVMFVVLTANDCSNKNTADIQRTREVAVGLEQRQPTPTDIDYSLERYNLIRRAYWVNGQREKARMLPSPIADMPHGYIILFAPNGGVLGRFVVEGKVTSLNSFLAPNSELYEINSGNTTVRNRWLPDVDGAYGENDGGIFFFTVDGRYLEWNGTYLYSDIEFEVQDPILKIQAQWGPRPN